MQEIQVCVDESIIRQRSDYSSTRIQIVQGLGEVHFALEGCVSVTNQCMGCGFHSLIESDFIQDANQTMKLFKSDDLSEVKSLDFDFQGDICKLLLLPEGKQ
eukprot:750446-Hanusia_phi.AAC.7